MSEHKDISEPKISEHTDTSESRMSEHTGTSESRMSEHKGTSESRMSEHKGTSESRMSEHLDTSEPNISEHTDISEPRMSEHLDTSEPKISEHTDTSEPRMSEHLDTSESKMSEHKNTSEPRMSENRNTSESKMSHSQALPEGKRQKLLQRKRTMFTEKQLETLNHMFNKNPYPDPNLKKEMASKMNINPTVLQVWFKNHRAKVKKAKCHTQQTQKAQPMQLAEDAAKSSPSQTDVDTPPRSPDSPCPVAHIYTNHEMPSFQLSICPTVKLPTNHPGSHKIVHFGCCSDSTIYCLHPLSESPDHSSGLGSSSFGSFPVRRERS